MMKLLLMNMVRFNIFKSMMQPEAKILQITNRPFIPCLAGLQREPKWGHLKDLHRALNLCKKALLWGNPNVQKLSADVEVSN
jgi:hypothetical protein